MKIPVWQGITSPLYVKLKFKRPARDTQALSLPATLNTMRVVVALILFISYVASQQVGTLTAENHPQLQVQTCTRSGCTTQQRSVVLDSNWRCVPITCVLLVLINRYRWTHTTSGSTNCYTGNEWDTSICPDPVTCAKNCAIDGADYQGTYGIVSGYVSLPYFLLLCY